ncbi:MAG: hypothetical protein EDM70_04470 [Candidatus Brocadia sp. AMX2]|nr:MAG: hypothetical protein EDM70_04470 [Candidatus Brocadia sp. AMX2]
MTCNYRKDLRNDKIFPRKGFFPEKGILSLKRNQCLSNTVKKELKIGKGARREQKTYLSSLKSKRKQTSSFLERVFEFLGQLNNSIHSSAVSQ